MAKIKSPNSQYCGVSCGVHFINGSAETTNENAIAWFKDKGYIVEDDEAWTEGISVDDIDDLDRKQLLTFAKHIGLSLSKKQKSDEETIREAIRESFATDEVSTDTVD